jgi:serine/threonine-protein kinase
MIGQIVDGRYEIVRQLGEGGMGAVYEAVHTGTGRRVAVKMILDASLTSPELVGRFQREARAAGAIDTEHIVQVIDMGTDRRTGAPFMAMEFL